MARPRAKGLQYFPHDVHASSDAAVERLEAKYGLAGYGFYWHVLERVYAAGGELDISEIETVQILASKVCGLSRDEFISMLDFCVSISLFDHVRYSERQIITSIRIKKQVKTVEEKRAKSRRKVVSEAETKQELDGNSETTPESKVNKSKEKKTKDSLAALPFEEFPSEFQTEEIRSEYADWIELRRKKRAPVTRRVQQGLFDKFPTPSLLLAALKNSNENGYTGVFAPRQNTPTQNHKPSTFELNRERLQRIYEEEERERATEKA